MEINVRHVLTNFDGREMYQNEAGGIVVPLDGADLSKLKKLTLARATKTAVAGGLEYEWRKVQINTARGPEVVDQQIEKPATVADFVMRAKIMAAIEDAEKSSGMAELEAEQVTRIKACACLAWAANPMIAGQVALLLEKKPEPKAQEPSANGS